MHALKHISSMKGYEGIFYKGVYELALFKNIQPTHLRDL